MLLLSELSAAPENTSKIPVAEPDHYEMGKRLVEELLKDNDGKLKQKKVGIFLSNNRSEARKRSTGCFVRNRCQNLLGDRSGRRCKAIKTAGKGRLSVCVR